jgi:GNAT superfamily N-acetyltransferase
MTETIVVDAAKLESLALTTFYHSILMPSFQPDELIDEQELLEGQRSGKTRTMLALDAIGDVLGGIVSKWYPISQVLLVAYLAVRSGHRGGGIGATLYRTALEQWSREFSPDLVLGEVQDMSNLPSAAHGDPVARLRFYGRLDADALDLTYFQPSLRPSAPRVFGMLLMVFQAGPAARVNPRRIDGGIVERFLVEYVSECEGGTRDSDEELNRLIEQCRQPGSIPLLDVSTILAAPRSPERRHPWVEPYG